MTVGHHLHALIRTCHARPPKHSGRWRRAKLLAWYASGHTISFPTHPSYHLFLFFSLSPHPLVDIQADRGRLLGDCHHDSPFVTLRHIKPSQRQSSSHLMIPARRNMPSSRRRRHGERGGKCDLPRQAKRVASRRGSLPIPSTSFFNTPWSPFFFLHHPASLQSMKMLNQSFSMESFKRELREYIVPEVVDAYLSAARSCHLQRHSKPRMTNRLCHHRFNPGGRRQIRVTTLSSPSFQNVVFCIF